MEGPALTALSPLDGRYADKVAALRPLFSEYGLIRQRVRVEIRWLDTLSSLPAVTGVPPFSEGARRRLAAVADDFSEADARRVKAIEAETNHDVKAVEYFLRERLDDDPELRAASGFLHFACTSEDINNLAYALMLCEARPVLGECLDQLATALAELALAHADQPMLSRTHGQPASPTTLGKEMAVFLHRLRGQRRLLDQVPVTGKFNGAVGNFNAHLAAFPDLDWMALSREFVTGLGLEWNPHTTQIENHDNLAAHCHALCRVNTVLIDLCRDLWGYISLGYFRQKTKAGEVGSSTMPHKVNPIDFENAEGNLGLANALLEYLAGKLPLSRWQRDLTDSTTLRSSGTALGHCLVGWQACLRGLGKLESDPARMQDDLDHNWEVLAEAVQTVMRRYGIPEPYEKLKTLTRGTAVDAARLREFILTLDLPDDAREQLLALTPDRYLGNAAAQARSIVAAARG